MQSTRGHGQPNHQNINGRAESNFDRSELPNGHAAVEERAHGDARAPQVPGQGAVPVATAVTPAGGLGGSPYVYVIVETNGRWIELVQAVNYVYKIKNRFSTNESVFKTFLGILQTYQMDEHKSIKSVQDQVSELFRDHDDLLSEFSHFLSPCKSSAR